MRCACSREVVAPQDVARSVGVEVALARRESPSLGDRFVGLSRALVHEMPATMAALSAGLCSERVAVAVVAATATLVPWRTGRWWMPGWGRCWAGSGSRPPVGRRPGSRRSWTRRRWWPGWRRRCKSRRVTVRPAPDGMAYLSVLGPLKDVVGAHAAVQARSRAVVAGQCPARGRRVGGWVRSRRTPRCALLSGREAGQLQPVEVHLVITDRALLGTGDPDRSVFEPARIPGHGSVPAPVARAWLREGLARPAACRRTPCDPDGRSRALGVGATRGAALRRLARAGRAGSGVGAAVVHHPGRAGPGRDGLPPAPVRWVVAPDAGAAR